MVAKAIGYILVITTIFACMYFIPRMDADPASSTSSIMCENDIVMPRPLCRL
jgi:hypothetical protein